MPISRKRRKPKRNILLTLLNIFIITLILSVVISAAIVFFIVKDALTDLPEIDPTRYTFTENSQILDSEGNMLGLIYDGNLRTEIRFDEISKDAINALVAIEDRTFWRHEGFNYVRLLGAVRDAIVSSSDISGTSTITQQLARNTFLRESMSDRSFYRKIREAYYAMQIEEALPKEDIITAYMNTIFLGANTDGYESAAKIYFSKHAKDLNYMEGAVLASIPKAPTDYAPMYPKERGRITSEDIIVGTRDSQYYYVYNSNIEERYHYVLSLMLEQGYISQSEYDTGIETKVLDMLKPSRLDTQEVQTYFIDAAKNQVINDLMNVKGMTEDEAYSYLYTGGLTIHSTLDVKMQSHIESIYQDTGSITEYSASLSSAVEEFQYDNDLSSTGVMDESTWNYLKELGYFSNLSNFPELNVGDSSDSVPELRRAIAREGYAGTPHLFPSMQINFDDGRIIDHETDQVMMYDFKRSIDQNGNFLLPSGYHYPSDNGDVLIEKNGLMFTPDAEAESIYLNLGDMYNYGGNSQTYDNRRNGLYTVDYILLYQNGYLSIPSEYLSMDGGEIRISKKAFDDEIVWYNEHDELVVDAKYVSVSDAPIVQPQSATVTLDHHNGYVRALVGGRNVVGNVLFNRATNPLATGSSIKPLSVYGPAIDTQIFTAASVVDDVPTYHLNPGSSQPWPTNIGGYRGIMTLREAIRVSQNVPAAKFGNEIGIQTMADYLIKNGITTLVVDPNEYGATDLALAPLTLGSLSHGISPMEMASAYGTFANEGLHIPWTTYTTVVDNDGNLILDRTNQEGVQVFSRQAAYIVSDLLRDVVRNYATGARLSSGMPLQGKTGTTDNRKDTWFCGSTPYYSTSLWIGTDRNIRLTLGSWNTASFFSYMMDGIYNEMEYADFPGRPEGVVWSTVNANTGLLPGPLSSKDPRGSRIIEELFIVGTIPSSTDNSLEEHEVCSASGKAPTEFCPAELLTTKVFVKSNQDKYYSEYFFDPDDTCDVHTKPPEPDPVPTPSEPTPAEPTPDPAEPTPSEP
jgi:penicillin-binding protein 1A